MAMTIGLLCYLRRVVLRHVVLHGQLSQGMGLLNDRPSEPAIIIRLD